MTSLLVWPIILPLAAALLTVLWPRRAAIVGVSAGVATLATVAGLVWRVSVEGPMLLLLGGWEPGLGIALRADPLAVALLLMSSLVTLAAGWYATGYFSGASKQRHFWPTWLLMTTALHAMLLSADLFNLYVTLELLGLSAVILAALGDGRAATEAALRYLTVGLVGSLTFLAGVTLVYANYGTLDMLSLTGMIGAETTAWISLALMSAGLLVKTALFPLHFWLPPAHSNAPAPVSAALSALVVKAAFYLILRLWLDVFHAALTPAMSWLLGLLGGAAVLWGSWHALRAPRLKQLAAYSTIAQLGYLFMFFPLLTTLPPGHLREAALGALVLMALSHGFAKSALFLAVGSIQRHAGHDRIENLRGTAEKLPMATFILALASVALIGLPPSGAFLAKWQLLSSAIVLGHWFIAVIVIGGSLLAAAYTVRILSRAFAPGDGPARVAANFHMDLPSLLLAVTATAVLGLGAATVWEFVAPAALSVGKTP